MPTAHLTRNPTKKKWKNQIGTNAIALNAVTIDELSVDLQAHIDQVDINKDDIAAIIASKGTANGLASLGADGKLNASQIPQIAISDFLAEVNDLTALYALGGQRGDWATVVPGGDATKAQSYMRIGDGNTAADWRAIVTPSDGVVSIRNVSGTKIGLNGVVTLADVAFSGLAADVAFNDVSYTATNVKDALVEVKAAVGDVADDVADLSTVMDGKLAVAGFYPYVELTGTIDGTNKVFTSTVDLAGAKVVAMVGGQVVHKDNFSVAGNNVTFTEEPTWEHQRPALMVFKAAA